MGSTFPAGRGRGNPLTTNTTNTACIQKGLLNRAGAITDDGRNAIEWTSLHNLKRPVNPATN